MAWCVCYLALWLEPGNSHCGDDYDDDDDSGGGGGVGG